MWLEMLKGMDCEEVNLFYKSDVAGIFILFCYMHTMHAVCMLHKTSIHQKYVS